MQIDRIEGPLPRFIVHGRLTVFSDGSLPPGFKRVIGPPYIIESPEGPEPGVRLATERDLIDAGLMEAKPRRVIATTEQQFHDYCREQGLNAHDSKQAIRITQESQVFGLPMGTDIYVLPEIDTRKPHALPMYCIWKRITEGGGKLHRVTFTKVPRTAWGCPDDTDGDGNCGKPACPICKP